MALDEQNVPGALSQAAAGDGYEMAEFLQSVSDDLPGGMEMEVTPYWDQDLDTLYMHFDLSYDPDYGPDPSRWKRVKHRISPPADQTETYSFSVEIPEHSHLHPDNEDYSLEPELPDLSRRKFLRGMALGTVFSICGVAAVERYEQANRPPYEKAKDQAQQLVRDVRRARKQGTDRSQLYLGNINDFRFVSGDDYETLQGPVSNPATVSGVLDDRQMTVEFIYFDEPLDKEEFLRRVGGRMYHFLKQGGQFYDNHGIPAHNLTLLSAGVPGIDFIRRYYGELLEEVSTVWREGDAYLDEQVSTFDTTMLEQAGDILTNEMQRVAPVDLDLDTTVRTEPLRLNESRELKQASIVQEYLDNPNRFPVFITTRNLDSGPYGWGAPGQALVKLYPSLLLHDGDLTESIAGRAFTDTTLMEVGHSVYRLPHTAGRRDSMTYNSQYPARHWVNGDVMGYGPITDAYVDRFLRSDLVWKDDELFLDVPAIDDDRADQLFDTNVAYHIHDMMDFPLDAWAETYRPDEPGFTLKRDEEAGTVTVDAAIDGYISDIAMDVEQA